MKIKFLGMTNSLGFSDFFSEKVSLTLLMNKIILYNDDETISERVTEHIFSYNFKEAGKYKITCDMASLDYKGIDQSKDFEIVINKTSEKRKEHYKQIEKREVKKIEPSYFQKLMSSVMPIGEDDDDEEEEDEEDDKNKKEKSKDENKDENKDEKKDENKEEKKEEKNDENNHEKQE